jgi:hypothetical protein
MTLQDILHIIQSYYDSFHHLQHLDLVLKELKSFAKPADSSIQNISAYLLCKIDGMPDLIA